MKAKKNLFALLLAAFLASFLNAETISLGEYLFSADIPEGFALVERRGNDRLKFQNSVFPAELQVAVYPYGDFDQAGKALSSVARQIGSLEECKELTWRGRKAAVSKLDFPLGKGWGAAAELPQEKGWLVVIAYTYSNAASLARGKFSEDELELFHLSVLDSFLTGVGNALSPGIVTTFAFPEEGELSVPFKTKKSEFSVLFNACDAKANQYVVDREFLVLTKYAGTALEQAAWKRFYRMIYRDAWKRMERASFMIANQLSSNATERAKELIEWLFSFDYTRDFAGSDFTSLPDAFTRKTGDCDTRCLLFVLLMRQMGTEAALLISPEFSHSVAAVALNVAGPVFAIEGKQLYALDLTSSKTGGKLSNEMAIADKWFAVTFNP